MLRIKNGVKICGIKPEAALGISVCAHVFTSYGLNCVVTSVMDGKHRNYSHHYKGLAWDLRSRHIPPEKKEEILLDLAQSLGSEFQVIEEPDHIHIEYDPAE